MLLIKIGIVSTSAAAVKSPTPDTPINVDTAEGPNPKRKLGPMPNSDAVHIIKAKNISETDENFVNFPIAIAPKKWKPPSAPRQ